MTTDNPVPFAANRQPTRLGFTRLSINQQTVRQLSLPELTAFCVELGITAVGLWREPVREFGVERTARILRAAGLGVSSLCRGGFLTAVDPAARAAALADNRAAIDEAAALGTSTLVLVSGGLPGAGPAGAPSPGSVGAALAPSVGSVGPPDLGAGPSGLSASPSGLSAASSRRRSGISGVPPLRPSDVSSRPSDVSSRSSDLNAASVGAPADLNADLADLATGSAAAPSDVSPYPSDVGPRPSDLGPRPSDLGSPSRPTPRSPLPPHPTCPSPFSTSLPDPARDLAGARERVADGLAELAPYAAERGVRLALEPLHPMFASDRCVVSTLGQALDLAERFPAEQVGVVVDTYHLWWDDRAPAQVARAGAGGRIAAFQLADWTTPLPEGVLLGRGQLGDGCVDLRGWRELVEEAGYRGHAEVEVFNPRLWERDGREVLAEVADRFGEFVL